MSMSMTNQEIKKYRQDVEDSKNQASKVWSDLYVAAMKKGCTHMKASKEADIGIRMFQKRFPPPRYRNPGAWVYGGEE